MTLKLKRTSSSSSSSPSPFSWNATAPSPPSSPSPDPDASPPTSWLSARDMKMFGSRPLRPEVGIVRCSDCDKPILKSAILEHLENCRTIRAGGKKGAKGKVAETEDAKKSKKRKADTEDIDDAVQPSKKKPKVTAKVTKGRFKGPVDYDKQCGVINDKGLPCSRSLTCKSHSMGAKRAVQNRSKPYDELLLEWNRANNPNWVEPVKRETKAEKKEKKEREKAEKKRLAMEAAAAAGIDINSKGAGGQKKIGKKAAVAAAAVALAEGQDEGMTENLADVDSEAEVDSLVSSVQMARLRGIIGVPLAVPCDASSWFVTRRERLRNCRELLANALMPNLNSRANLTNGIGTAIAAGVPSGPR